MKSHPYQGLPDHAYWRRAVAGTAPNEIDPVTAVPWTIDTDDRVVTAGSCFAQHIARHLRAGGYNYLVTEKPHPLLGDRAEAYGYGIFTARYGNIYTTRQLVQLFDRVMGRFTPAEDVWNEPDGSLIDPFRPQIQPGGFASLREYQVDRAKHFACVREALKTLDLMVFTLGLTEAWRSVADGAVYPLCPGVAGGTFDPDKYEFHNFTVDEVTVDICTFIDCLRAVNPKARVMLTVSPVPLVATASGRHVLEATVYSKSVLRIACAEAVVRRPGTVYFPSYEIITGTSSTYFAADRRSVTEAGVAHVMRVFMRNFAATEPAGPISSESAPLDPHEQEMAALVEVDCDEVALDDQHRGHA